MSASTADPRFYHLRDAMFNDWEAAAALIAQDATIIEARSGIGETVLHYLAVENYLGGIEWLLKRGANINTRNDFEGTPLTDAASLGYLELCRFLLDNGADILAMDHLGATAISAACISKPVNKALLHMLLEYRGKTDINLFFDDLDAEDLLTRKSPRIAEFWSALGLRSRYNYPPPDFEDEEN